MDLVMNSGFCEMTQLEMMQLDGGAELWQLIAGGVSGAVVGGVAGAGHFYTGVVAVVGGVVGGISGAVAGYVGAKTAAEEAWDAIAGCFN